MANIRYILLSCVLALLANESDASEMSTMQGSKAGREISLERYVMPSSQREHTIDKLEEKCEPYKLVGMRVNLSWSKGGVSSSSLKPWGLKIARSDNGDGSDLTIDTTIYCT